MLEVENLYKQYVTEDGTPGGGVFGIGFEVAEGELFTLLGPSGCGKTTTLRSIAGLETPDAGRVALAGADIFNSESRASVPPFDRDIGMVFQSYAIWPHLTVFENAAYPLQVDRKRRFSRSEIRDKVKAVLETVDMAAFMDRPSTQLSGGQQQRLALARALAREPRLLLLDEPLSNLDAQLREQMRVELKRMQREWGVTSIYVTHDQSEALAISDRIAVMNAGKIAQVGPPEDIYDHPASEFVAGFIGKTNLLRGRLAEGARAGSLGAIETPIGAIRCRFRADVAAGEEVAAVIRPENVVIGKDDPGAADGPGGANHLQGRVAAKIYLGEITEYTLAMADGSAIVVRIPPGGDIAAGDAVRVHFPPEKTVALIED